MLKKELQAAKDEYEELLDEDNSNNAEINQKQVELKTLETRVQSESEEIGKEVSSRRASLTTINQLSEQEIEETMKKNTRRMSKLL